MEWTKEQLDAVSARGSNLLVSAAAGSGKTAVLTERVAKLAEEGTDLSRMLIITFTNAAAAEMKQRISERVPLSVLTKYSISTFNKFAIDIYKSYYHIIGLPPGLAVCDEYKQEILKSEAMDEMFEDHFEADDEDFKRFLTFYCSPKNNDAARAMISSLYKITQSMPDPEGWIKKISEEPFKPAELFKYASEC
ncbi:MAG: UvrD-helicase domain-containing protein, partial [Desulfovibrionaceae bacterium]|nr:UvrD-helicase domain-containing protein [Desulfovibrionaceae bacterium]